MSADGSFSFSPFGFSTQEHQLSLSPSSWPDMPFLIDHYNQCPDLPIQLHKSRYIPGIRRLVYEFVQKFSGKL